MTTKQNKPKRLISKSQRESARYTRNFQWKFTERVAQHNPLWFCVWNKEKRPELADEMRCCLLSGMDIMEWLKAHKDWFKVGRWSKKRYAVSVRLTNAGRRALAERDKYDMEDVYGGLVEPGYVVKPLPPAQRSKGGVNEERTSLE